MKRSLLIPVIMLGCAAALLCACDPTHGTGDQTSAAVTTPPVSSEPPVTTEKPEDKTTISAGGAEVFSTDAWLTGPFTVAEGDELSYVRSGDGPAMRSIRVDYGDGSGQTFAIPEGSACESFRLLRSGECRLSFVLGEEDGETYLVSTAAAFADAARDPGFAGGRLEQLCDIFTDADVTVTVPFTWITGGFYFSCGELRFESAEAGSMTIDDSGGSGIACRSLLCLTPEWDYTLDRAFSDFSEQAFCRVDARSVNGRTVDRSYVRIGSADDLARFFGGPFSAYADGIRFIEFSGDFELPDLELRDAESLVFFGSVSAAGSVRVTSSLGSLTVDTSSNACDVSGALSVDAPAADMIWTGTGAPGFSFAERYYNVRSYNGEAVDPALGGNGSGGLISIKADATEGSLEGRYVVFRIPYSSATALGSAALTPVLGEGCTGRVTASPDGRYYYTVTDPASGTFTYRLLVEYSMLSLPVVYLTTDGGAAVTSTTKWIGGTFSIDYNGFGGTSDRDDINAAAVSVRGRGHSSWELAKKPYSLKFESKVSLFGLPKAKDWVLQANHADYSLLRNKLAMDIGQVLDGMLFVPHSQPVDVFLNGKYIGMYTLSEKVEIASGRIEAEKDSSETDTDYLLEIGGEMSKTSWGGSNVFTTSYCIYVEIKDPDVAVLTKEQFDYIFAYVRKADAAVKAKKDYDNYIDIDSAIDWFILTELSYNTDGAMRRSDFLLKTRGPEGKIYFAAPWDFDYAFGNIYFDAPYEEWICLGKTASLAAYEARKGYKYIRDNWFTFLLTDPAFKTRLKDRWNAVKEDVYAAAVSSINTQKAACLLSGG
jgi:hypothetical protein